MQSDRLKNDGHALVTFKIFFDDCCDDAAPEEIMQHLIEDYQQRLAKLQRIIFAVLFSDLRRQCAKRHWRFYFEFIKLKLRRHFALSAPHSLLKLA